MTTDTYAPSAVGERIRDLCRQFRLPTLAAETVDRFSDAGHADALPTLVEVLEQEAEDRRIRRVDRLRRASKTWDTFEHDEAQASWSLTSWTVPGLSARGQDACHVRHRAQAGAVRTLRAVHPGMQDIGQARPRSARMLRKLDNYDLLVIDDLGYLPQGAEESEVLFTLSYERRSLGITSNLVF